MTSLCHRPLLSFLLASIAFTLLSTFQPSHSHLCVYSPKQRGPIDISKPSGTCYRPEGPCGGEKAERPKVTYTVGQTYDIHFQQHLNHYFIGYSGVLEVSWNQNGNDESEENFHVLHNVPDYFSHRELYQTNMTYRFNAPMQATDHGILRIKYISHKPGEPEAFYQCVDVKVAKDESQHKKTRALVGAEDEQQDTSAKGLYALLYNPAQTDQPSTQIVRINTADGTFKAVDSIPVPLRTMRQFDVAPSSVLDRHQLALSTSAYTVLEDVVTYVDDVQILIYLIGYADPHRIPDQVLLVPLTHDERRSSAPQIVKMQEFNPESNSHNDISNPISFITWVQDVEKFFIGQMVKVDDKTFFWTLSTSDREMQNIQQIARGPDEKLQINYLWNEYDSSKSQLSLLFRDEHDPFNLNMTRYSVDINTGKVSAQDIDTSKTFSCFHTSSTGAMFAPSVGSPEVFFPQDKMIVNNEILAVDLPSGTYKKLRDTGVMNTPWQGGCVHRGLTEDQRLLHVYRSPKAGSYVYGAHSVNGEVKTDFVQENSAYGLMHSFIYVKE